VIKRSGVTEPFSRTKVIEGVRKACQGRPVRQHDLALLAQQVEDTLRSSGAAEVGSEQIGKAILGPLKDLDEVAYLRFASVYLAFDSLADFETAIAALRASPAGPIEDPEAPAGDDLSAGRLAAGRRAPADLVAGDLAGVSTGRGSGLGGVKTG
jgi:transcriptional repressor NrdR